VCELDDNYQFFKYNRTVNGNDKEVASHVVIKEYIDKNGKDYRFEEKPHPIKQLKDRHEDNTSVGREC
jgi:hypothetical protein